MRQRVYRIEDGNPATIAPVTEMVPCDWCGFKMTPMIPAQHRTADDVVTHNGVRICVRCGLDVGVVVCEIVDVPLNPAVWSICPCRFWVYDPVTHGPTPFTPSGHHPACSP